MSFGDNLRYLRRSAGLTQGELAKRIRLRGRIPSRSYITQLESGRIDPRLSTIRSLARALGVKPWMLVADLSENTDFWRRYLSLPPEKKREVQRHLEWMMR